MCFSRHSANRMIALESQLGLLAVDVKAVHEGFMTASSSMATMKQSIEEVSKPLPRSAE